MRIIKNILIIAVVIVVGWNSVYFAKLDEVKASKEEKEFDATRYANEFWNKKLLPNIGQAVELSLLLPMLETDPAKAFRDYSHALGIGNLRYFLIRGAGKVESVHDDYVTVRLSDRSLLLETEFIFGNAVRDASGLIDINDFDNTMDFNNVSAEINKIIREQVLPSFKENVKRGESVEFIGAIELNKEHLQLKNIEVIPVQLKIVK